MAGSGSTKGFDMQHSWVNQLSSKVPILVVAVDDALLSSADRVLHTWKKSGASMPPSLSLRVSSGF